ncbi:MAG: hypothetical protein ABIS45_13965 [Burkholderiales bacterium]
MSGAIPGVSWYGAFRVVVFALLICNTAYYLVAGTPSKGLDALAWLLLLMLFVLETGFSGRLYTPGIAVAVRIARIIAAIGVCAAGAGYLVEQDSLDAINSGLWIAVVILLEVEVRRPRAVAHHHIWFAATAGALYTGLAVLVLSWAWRNEWMDAYDALLWLIAFAAIEMDLLALKRAQVTA